MPDWEHIKQEIAQHQEPLSTGAWSDMDGLLNAQPKRKVWAWFVVVPLLLGVAIFTFISLNADRKLEVEQNKTQENAIENNVANENNLSEETPRNTIVPVVEEAVIPPAQTGNESKKTDKPIADATPVIPAKTTESGASQRAEKTTRLEKLSSEEIIVLQTKSAEFEIADTENTSLILVENEGDSLPKVASSPSPLKSKWEMKLFAGATYNMANIKYSDAEDYTHKDLQNSISEGLQPGWGFDAGAELSYFVTPHFKISSGVGIRKIVTQNSLDYSISQIPVIDSASGKILGYITLPGSPVLMQNTSQNQYTYLSIPLSLFHEIKLGGKWSLTGEFINTASFLINQKSVAVNTATLEIQDANKDEFNKVLFAYQLKLGLRYNLNKNISLAFEPAYRGQYNNLFNSEYVSWKPKDISLNLALIYKFKNSTK